MYWQRFNPPTLIFIPVSIREPIFYSQYTYIYIYTEQHLESIERDHSFPGFLSFFPFLPILVFFTLPLSIASLPVAGKSGVRKKRSRSGETTRPSNINVSARRSLEHRSYQEGWLHRRSGGVNKPEGRRRINGACLKSSVKFRRFRPPPLPAPRFLAFLARALILRFNGMQSSTNGARYRGWSATTVFQKEKRGVCVCAQRNEI